MMVRIKNNVKINDNNNKEWKLSDQWKYTYFICLTIVLLPDSPAPVK